MAGVATSDPSIMAPNTTAHPSFRGAKETYLVAKRDQTRQLTPHSVRSPFDTLPEDTKALYFELEHSLGALLDWLFGGCDGDSYSQSYARTCVSVSAARDGVDLGVSGEKTSPLVSSQLVVCARADGECH